MIMFQKMTKNHDLFQKMTKNYDFVSKDDIK